MTVVPERDAWKALAALVIGFFMILVDQTIVAVATEAMPATAPHAPMAAPRRSGANTRVITLNDCGVSSAAPKPWNTRATMSVSMFGASPHHREAPVNTVNPAIETALGPI